MNTLVKATPNPFEAYGDAASGRRIVGKLMKFSKGGIGAIGELCKVFGRHMREAPDEDPVIALGVGSYQHRDKQYGRIKFPILEVVDWVDKAPFEAALETGGPDGGSAPAAAPDTPVIAHQKQEAVAKAVRRGVKLEDTF